MSKAEKLAPRVLVVDDEESNIATVTAVLRSAACVVLAAKSGEEGLRIAASRQPDIILLDVKMPGIDGYQAARSLSANEQTNSIPIIMVTSLSGTEDRTRALNAGAVDFLTKPVEAAELQAKVSSLARLKSYNDEMKRRQAELRNELAGQGEQLRTILEVFARFVPQEFLQALEKKDIAAVKLGDSVKLNLAILFSDIRSFTTLSEKMSPEQCFRFLNSYLNRMNPLRVGE